MTGQTILHFRILEKIGEGGMGAVYKAQDTHLDRLVAVKFLPADRLADPDRRQRFVLEAKAASSLNHPNIIVIHDIASDGGRDFIVMEYVEGKTLDQLIGRKGMKLNEALVFAVQIADGLARAHAAGIVHRDLKPTNVMVTADGPRQDPRLRAGQADRGRRTRSRRPHHDPRPPRKAPDRGGVHHGDGGLYVAGTGRGDDRRLAVGHFRFWRPPLRNAHRP